MVGESRPLVVILCGGLGTRIRSVIGETPKVLAEVNGLPFLVWQISYLYGLGFRDFHLALGYRADAVLSYISSAPDKFENLKLEYTIEDRPLGTAGAVANVVRCNTGYIGDMLILNGDTFVFADFKSFISTWKARQENVGLLSCYSDDANRYGLLDISNKKQLNKFTEKTGENKAGWINAGAYLITRESQAVLSSIEVGSLEYDFFENGVLGNVFIDCQNVPFLDIGTEETYWTASDFLKKHMTYFANNFMVD
ncbi:sugar phosphate nucleotidyltransferase [Curvivirga sp.]|uniref:sugar phosphate nucleotidyltransferase n=1 Tax=Curvivirga sp. TaxID=2856848 RepID=UPI003B5C0B19